MSRMRSAMAAVGAVAVAATTAVTVAAPGAYASTNAGILNHAVFVQTNDAAGNQVIAYERGIDGRLAEVGQYRTGGRGGSEPGAVVDPLASQGSLTYDARHRLLLAVNAGSDTLSVFAVRGTHLRLEQVLATHGALPTSVGVAGDVAYVLDAAGDGAISGYRIAGDRLHDINGSTRSLGLGNDQAPNFLAAPAQVAITPDARSVIVATKNHNTLVVFPLGYDLRPNSPKTISSEAPVPFALSFDAAGRLLVVEASGGASSYNVSRGGTLSVISSHVANGQKASCWSVMARGYLYAANAGSATITGYRDVRGELSLLDPSGVTATTDAGAVDLAASSDGKFLYDQATGAGAIDEYAVNDDGSLTQIGNLTGFTRDNGAGIEGIAAS